MRLISLGTAAINPDHIIFLQTELVPERGTGVVIIHLVGGKSITYHLDKPDVPLETQADDLIQSIQKAASDAVAMDGRRIIGALKASRAWEADRG